MKVITPKDRTHEGPIHAAVEAAEAKALPRAIADARAKAAELARLSGLTLGADRVDLRRAGVALRAVIGFYSRFGPDRFCGTVRTAVFKTDKTTGKRVRVGTRSRHICQIPPTVVSTVTVTFAA